MDKGLGSGSACELGVPARCPLSAAQCPGRSLGWAEEGTLALGLPFEDWRSLPGSCLGQRWPRSLPRHLEGAWGWWLVWLGMERIGTSLGHAFDLYAYRRPQRGHHH